MVFATKTRWPHGDDTVSVERHDESIAIGNDIHRLVEECIDTLADIGGIVTIGVLCRLADVDIKHRHFYFCTTREGFQKLVASVAVVWIPAILRFPLFAHNPAADATKWHHAEATAWTLRQFPVQPVLLVQIGMAVGKNSAPELVVALLLLIF